MSSHRQIFKSTALIGGAQVINILVGMIRVKFTAVYLGTFGVGLFGAYTSILGPLGTLAGVGLNSSGVRQIAEAVGRQDEIRIAKTLKTVRRTAWVTGTLGMILMLFLSYPLCLVTFGNTEHIGAIGVLSITILLTELSGGLGSIIQGMRRIRDMATQSILGSVLSLPIAIPLMMFFGVQGLVPMMIASSLVGVITTWWFARKISVKSVGLSWGETWREAKPLLKMGIVFMGAGLMSAATAYVQRIIIIRNLGIEANGIYSSAYNLSNYYIGFILGAMAADFYPRLTAVHHNNQEVKRLVNEQTQVGIIMALPGIIGSITLAPLVIQMFYTPKFLPAVEVLRWQTLGLMLRIISWPMGYILAAKGLKRMFFATELINNIASILFLWIGINYFGLKGTGISFFALYLFYLLLIYPISKKFAEFNWEVYSFKLIAISILSIALIMVISNSLSYQIGLMVGIFTTSCAIIYSLQSLKRILGYNPFTSFLKKLISR